VVPVVRSVVTFPVTTVDAVAITLFVVALALLPALIVARAVAASWLLLMLVEFVVVVLIDLLGGVLGRTDLILKFL